MQAHDNMFALLAEESAPDMGGNTRNNKKKQQKKNQGNRGGNQNKRNNKGNNKPQTNNPRPQASKGKLNSKAAAVFRQQNALTEQQKRDRNRKRRQKQAQKKVAAKAQKVGEKPMTKVQLEKLEKDRKRKVTEFLRQVAATMNGNAVQCEIDLKDIPDAKASKSIIKDMKDSPFKTISEVLKSTFFFENLVKSLSPGLRSDVARIKKAVRVQKTLSVHQFTVHMQALLARPSLANLPAKSNADVFGSVDGYFEGLFGLKLSEDKEDLFVDFYAGSNGSQRSRKTQLSAFIDLPDEPAKPATQKKKTTATKGKQPITKKMNNRKEENPGPEPLDTVDASTIEKLTESSALLAQRIPRGWRIVMVRLPVFGAPVKRNPEKKDEAPKPGFLYRGQGHDFLYFMWNGSQIITLFVSGSQKPVPTPTQKAQPAKGNQPKQNQNQGKGKGGRRRKK